MRRSRFRWGIFGAAALVSLALHLAGMPRLLRPFLEKREAPVEVAYLPELDPPGPPQVPSQPPRPQPTPKAAEQKPPEVAKVEPPPPEPEKPPELQLAKPPPPPPPLIQPRMKMVDQDRPDDEPDNPDAHYLAQKNHRATDETRALATNLVRNQRGEERPAAPESPDRRLQNPGEKERKIAELEERKGRERQVVRSKPLVGDEGRARRPGKKAKRAEARALAQSEEKTIEPGPGPMSTPGGEGGKAAEASKGGKPRLKLTLDASDYDRIEGEAAVREREEAARAQRSRTVGRWERVQQKMAAMRSSLENFTPEVRPGNQSELGTRAHPFAAYIAEMHRAIHKLWAFGYLADLDAKSPGSAYNAMDRWAQLEIVLRGDGNVEKVTIVRPSGLAPFDAAAIDAVASAGPFPSPPDAIRSANGKVYLDWRFHRDDRQCGTFGVDPHILTTPGENQSHDTSEVAKAPRVAPPRVVPHPTRPSAPIESPPEVAVPDAAREAAEGWFGAYARGDLRWLSGWSAAPFTAGGQVAAADAAAVRHLYAELLREAPRDRKLGSFEVLTAAAIRAKLGSLPPGGEGTGSMLFAVGSAGGERFVLLLKKSDAGWRVCGIDR